MTTTTDMAQALPLEQIIAFLLGEDEIYGFWYGETPEGKGNYWWRTHLRESWQAHESRAQPASVADGWREKFDELLEDYAGARAEVAVWNVTQSVQPPTGIRLPRSRLAKLRAHVDQIAAAPQPAKDSDNVK